MLMLIKEKRNLYLILELIDKLQYL